MKIVLDKLANAMRIEVRAGRSARTVDAGRGMVVDYDRRGNVLSIEVLGADRVLDGRLSIPSRLFRPLEAATGQAARR
ncbi:MAG TPA: DUF2283 domain-containing protein [Deinococcales bacterium]|nr:DUF2283 domain-containing protein [Deinococcales bacterium]